HTGRPLVLPGGLVTAFILIHLAALVRVITAFEVIPWNAGVGVSSLLWMLAFGIFLARYTRILASPRPDGKEG
ncbi:MAG: NnrS family protein, partial [Marinobacter sp.]|nr:NnrS family protein [Marinobacter sp.]